MSEYISPHVPNNVPRMLPVDICGLSGRFPESSSASEFYCNLISGVDMVTADERKWKHFMQNEVPRRCGKFKEGELFSFDPQFFGVHGQQAKKMDPQLYKLLEVSWEAWTDSCIDVRALRDSNRVGVYTGICGSEVHGYYISNKHDITGYEQTGCVMAMTANRLSFFYSFRGPSKTCDTACSSAAHSLHDAIADITAGRIDYALVLGSCHILAPNMTLAFNRLHMLSPEGACKAFDAAGNGYVRSEGIAAIVLKRADLDNVPQWAGCSPYATILNCGVNNDGFTKEGVTFPSRHAQLALEKQVCNEADINPADISYVEAHGTGTVAGDGQELDAINKWYGQAPGRTEPVQIGSVKSNMGHCEGASCLASVVKLCLALEYGLMPGNLHYHPDTPNPESEGLRDGTLKVCDKTQPWEGGLIALSSFGFGGANMHMILQGQAGQRIQLQQAIQSGTALSDDDDDPVGMRGKSKQQSIIPLAARTAEGLVYLAKVIKKAERADGASFEDPLRRYANTAATDMRLGHRGTLTDGVLKAGSAVTQAPEVWYVFSGNGSQWSKMGLTLLNSNAVFHHAVSTCAAVLEPMSIDLIAEFNAARGWQTPLLGAVGLLAVQIGLVDVLQEEHGVVPDGILGHSAGEIACTYASGCCTKEQAMLIAYHRGRLPTERGITTGIMAATGLSADQVRERTAGTNVVLACDNSPTSTTVAGPADDVKRFLKDLEAEDIFNRVLDTNGVPYHSSVLQPLLPELTESLNKVIPNPVERPSSWLSAAFPLDSEDPKAAMCSAAYQVHSYRSPVLFTGAVKAIPKNALLVEIGPHSILRSPLRQSRPDLGYVGTMKKGDCAAKTLATAVGDMWRQGVPIQWTSGPVPTNATGTEVPRSIREALTSWDRTLFDVPMVIPNRPGPGVKFERMYDLGGEDSYICDHAIDGNVFIPLSCFLVTAWEAFAQWDEKLIWDVPVEFSDVSVYMPVQVERTAKVQLDVIFDFSNRFQVTHGTDVVCDGVLKKYNSDRLPKENVPLRDCQQYDKPGADSTGVSPETHDHLTGEHWYGLCERQNLQYGPKFQMVAKYGVDRSWCDLKWDRNWIIHLDGVFQTADRLGDHHVHVARGMRRLAIVDTMPEVEAGYIDHFDFDTFWKVTRGRSVILEGYKDEIATSKHKAARTLVHKSQWLPYGQRPSQDMERAEYGQQLLSLLKGLTSGAKGPEMLKIKEAIAQLPLQAMSESKQAALLSDKDHILANLLTDSLTSSVPAQDITARRPDFDKASEEDLVLRVASQEDVDSLLAIAISNMKASGYSVGEVGAGNGALTKQALVTCIKVPQSALLSYTAMDKEHSSDITRRVPHKTLAYKHWDINDQTADRPGPFNIVVARHLSQTAQHLPSALAALQESLHDGGFLMLQELTGPLGAAVFGMSKQQWQHTDGRAYGPCTSTDHWRQMLADAGLAEVSTVICPSETTATFLYRKLPAAPPRVLFVEFPSLHADTPTMDSWLNEYRAALDEVDRDDGNPGTLWLYGTFEEQPGLLGFLHSARKEHKGNCVRALIGWGEPRLDYRSAHDAVGSLDLCVNVFKGGAHGIYAPLEAPYKHLKGEDECLHGAHLNFETYGNLKSAVWRENRPFPQDSSVVICDVTYGALNFRDVMLAYGKLSKQQMAHESGGDNIGFEFSGTTGGRRVMGSAINALATKVITRPNLLWDVPNDWSLAEAATIPTAYMTAYYALVMRGRLRSGMRVLIHSGTGAVGLAAIQICLHRGAEVFVTVGSAAKRQFLLGTFPKLQEDHIGDSRSTSFEGLVLNKTRGKGVHLLLNSLTDEKLQASVRCLGHWGKLLEIGKYDILQGTPLSMRPMLNNISFEGIDVDRVMNHPDSTELEDLNKLVSEGLISGEVRPLPVTVYPRTHIEEAFRFLASGMHIGKVLIDTTAEPKEPSSANCLSPKSANLSTGDNIQSGALPLLQLEPSVFFRPDRSYIITGGLGGFGMAMAEYLGDHGAKHIVITSKRGVRNGGQQAALQELQFQHINFKVTTLDVGVPDEAEQIIQLAERMAPVGGIFHLAMYLADKLLANQTGESWNKVMHAKAHGAHNLDKASRRLNTLEHFVMWSSIVASAGNEGQTNYAAANAALDILAEKRREEGLPAMSVQWGVVDHVGVADKAIQELMEAGLLGASMPQPIDSCLKTLGRLMLSGPKSGAVMASSWQPLDILGKGSASNSKKDLLGSILTVMGLSASAAADSDTLSRLGIDSMQMVEVRSKLQRALGRSVALEDVQSMTIASIKVLEGVDEDAAPAVDDSAPVAEAVKDVALTRSAPVIEPCKIVDLSRDLPSLGPMKPAPLIKASYDPVMRKQPPPISHIDSISSLAPATPDRDLSDNHGSNDSTSSRSANSSDCDKMPAPAVILRSRGPLHEEPIKPAAKPAGLAATPVRQADNIERDWDFWSKTYSCGIVVVLSFLATHAFGAASSLALRYGVLIALPLVPLLYMLMGLGLVACTVAAKWTVLPRLAAGTPVPMWSTDFARWWFVCRMVDVTNALFMRHFCGTVLLNWYYNLLGATIPTSAVIDSMELTDFDFLSVGENTVIGKGTTIIAHTFKDGNIIFSQINIGADAQTEPYALVTPGTNLKSGSILAPLARAGDNSHKKPSAKLASVMSNHVISQELSLLQFTLAQVAIAMGNFLLAGAAGCAGCAAFAFIWGLTNPGIAVPSAAYLVCSLVAMSSPMLAIFGFFILPAHSITFSALWSLTPALASSFVALPLAFIVAAVAHIAAAALAKHLLVGRVVAGVHRRLSAYGALLWASQLLVESTIVNYGNILVGTWALNALYSAFGASIGKLSVIRNKTPAIGIPDMLTLGERVVCGDTTKIVTSMALGSQEVLVAPVIIENMGTIGAWAVIMPGVTVGQQATLAPLTIAEAGSDMKPRTVYMGAQAQPVKTETRGEPGLDMHVFAFIAMLAMPVAQIFAVTTMALASHIPSAAAAVFLLAANPGPLGSTLAAIVAMSVQCQIIGRLNVLLQLKFSAGRPARGIKQWSLPYITGCALATITIYCNCFGEALWKGSPSWVNFLRRTGISIGSGVYLDADWLGEPGVTYADGAIAGKGSIVFGHLLAFNGQHNHMEYTPVNIGKRAQVGARAAVLPGVNVEEGGMVKPGELVMML